MSHPPTCRRLAATAAVLALAASLPAGVSAQEAVGRAEVERVISSLASDAMRGRSAFTEDAERAAAFLAGEFRDAGLETMPGVDGHLQRFAVYTVERRSVRLTLNGATVPPANVFTRSASARVSWATGDARVVTIGAGADASETLRANLLPDANTLVIVDPALEATVQQFRRFFAGPNRVTELGGPAVVIALAEVTEDPDYRLDLVNDVSEAPLANVVGTIPGRRSDEIVLFSAHYDHIGIRPPVNGDSIANGANDDASGTTAVVMLARHFAARGTPERTLVFAAFTAEERGGYGSRYFSSRLDPDRIVAMFNIEMIGKPAVEGPNTAWITGFERSSLGAILQRAVAGTPYAFHPDPYPEQNLFYRSDNATLARLGVPAHSISTTPIDVDTDYHQVSDHVETLDLDHMTNTIRAIAAGAATIVSGAETPTRVDPETVERPRGG